MSNLPLLPLPPHRQIPRKALSSDEKIKNLESCLKKIKSHDKVPKKPKEVAEIAKPNQETTDSSSKLKPAKPEPAAAQKGTEVKEKRKPGRPAKKKLND